MTRPLSATRERECKLRAPRTFSLVRLAERLGPYRLATPEMRRLHTTYFDTPDLRLMRWGASLRYRRGEGWTLKLPQPAIGRTLYRTKHVFDGDLHHVPDGALDLAAAMLRGQQPLALAELRTIRTQRNVSRGNAETLAEVVEDDVRIVRGTTVVGRFRQVKIELNGDTPAVVLDQLRRRLRKRGAGKADGASKAAITLAGGPGKPDLRPPQLRRNATIFALVQATLAASVEGLVRIDPVLRSAPDANAVHDARVAVRKLRSYLRTFAPVTEAGWARQLGDRLRWLSDGFSSARDADVLLNGLTECAGQVPFAERHDAEELLQPFRERRAAAYERLAHVLREPQYFALIDALIDAANAPRVREPQRAARTVVPALMQRIWKRMRKRVRRAGDEPTDHDLHGIRIQAKHLRYAAEALGPIYGSPARRFARRAEALQVLLGKQHDAVTAAVALRERLAASAHAFLAGYLAAMERTAATSWRAHYAARLQALARPASRRFWREEAAPR